MVDIGEDMAEKPHHDVISEEVLSDDNESVDEIASSTRYESSQQIFEPSDSLQCPQCNTVFTDRRNMMRHVRSKHEGVRYPCNQCDYKAASQSYLKLHIESVHYGVRFPCSQCDHIATRPDSLKRHIKSRHEC